MKRRKHKAGRDEASEARAEVLKVIEQALLGEDLSNSLSQLSRLAELGKLPPRAPGSARGQVHMADDFDTPEDFRGYV